MDPADAEADSRRPQPVRQGQDVGLAAAREHESVQLQPLVEALDDRLLGLRLGEGDVEVREEVVLGLDQEDPALAARVGRLQHRRQADVPQGRARLVHRPERGEARLRHACVGEPASHRDLVRHQVRHVGADRGQPEPLGDGRDHGHGPVGAHRQGAVDFVALSHFLHGLDVGEVHDLGDVGRLQPESVRVPVDADDAEAELPRPLDRAPLVTARADEEDRPRHGGGCYPGASVATITSATRSAARPSTSPTTSRATRARSSASSAGSARARSIPAATSSKLRAP